MSYNNVRLLATKTRDARSRGFRKGKTITNSSRGINGEFRIAKTCPPFWSVSVISRHAKGHVLQIMPVQWLACGCKSRPMRILHALGSGIRAAEVHAKATIRRAREIVATFARADMARTHEARTFSWSGGGYRLLRPLLAGLKLIRLAILRRSAFWHVV